MTFLRIVIPLYLFVGSCSSSLVTRRYREIIRGPSRARQRKMPPLFRIVHKTLLRHRGDQQVPPAALGRCNGSRSRMRLDVATIIAGSHVDACFRRASARGRGAVGIGLAGIEGTRIVGLQIDQSEVEGGAGGMSGMLGDIAQPE